MDVLVVIAPGRGRIERILDRSPFTLGRDPGSDLVLDFSFISRTQLVLERDARGAWRCRPEGRNPVKLEGRVIEGPHALEAGARVEMGPITATIEVRDVEEELGAVTLEVRLSELGEVGYLAELVALGEAAIGSSDEAFIADHAATAAMKSTRGRGACVATAEEILGRAGARIDRVSRRLFERALEGRSALRVENNALPDGLEDARSILDRRAGSIIVAPLGPPARGVVYVERDLQSPAFEANDVAFVTVLAHLTGAWLGAAGSKRATIDRLNRDIERRGGFGKLVGASAAIAKLGAAIAKVAPSDTTVLIHGETGTGKELVAREVHHRSARSEAPFFALNCAALPENLIESELFGHRRGAFSGADRDRPGVFEIARGGTVFLDEIGELPLVAQAKVLRALDAREIQPLGGTMPVKIDVRVVAATHRDLEAEVGAGRFRRDLLYRLKVFTIEIPPLRERASDVAQLVRHFFDESAEAKRKGLAPPTPEAIAALEAYAFPGNVRELAHLVEQAVILAEEGEAIDVAHLPEEIAAGRAVAPVRTASNPSSAVEVSLRDAVADFERAFIIRELEKDAWNRTATARRLQVPLRSFMDRLKRLDIKK